MRSTSRRAARAGRGLVPTWTRSGTVACAGCCRRRSSAGLQSDPPVRSPVAAAASADLACQGAPVEWSRGRKVIGECNARVHWWRRGVRRDPQGGPGGLRERRPRRCPLEVIDVEDGEYPAAYRVDGAVLALLIQGRRVVLVPTGEVDEAGLRALIGDYARRVPSAPRATTPLDFAESWLQEEWQRRWLRRPRWADRRLHGLGSPGWEEPPSWPRWTLGVSVR